MKKAKYSLGLDLGIGSVGWAVMAEEDGRHHLDDFGVRIFDPPHENANKTNASIRRQIRSQRRLIRRRKHRIKRLKLLLDKIDFLSWKIFEDKVKNYKSTVKVLKTDIGFRTEDSFYNHFALRNKGLKFKLEKHEIYLILIHFAKKRGYNNRFLMKEENKEDKKSNFDSALSRADSLIAKHKFISTAILKDNFFRNKNGVLHVNNTDSLYRCLFSRKHHQKEIEQILKTQSNFYDSLTNENIKEIVNTIYSQRDFEDGPKCRNHYKESGHIIAQCSKYKTFLEMEGKCIYYPKENRGYKSSLLFTVFLFVTQINNFLQHFKIKLSKESRFKLISGFVKNNWDKNAIKKGLTDLPEWENDWKDYFKSPVWKGNKTKKIEPIVNLNNLQFFKNIHSYSCFSKILNTFNEQGFFIQKLEKSLIHELGKIIHENTTPDRLKNKLEKFLKENNLDLPEENGLLEIQKNSKTTANVSFKFMRQFIQWFLDGENSAQKSKYLQDKVISQLNFGSRKEKTIFASPIKDLDLEKNYVVFRAMNQSRKVLEALFKKYGTFSNINVEMARDIYQSKKNKDKITQMQGENRKDKSRITALLKSEHLYLSTKNINAVRLWEQQNKECIYCGKRNVNLREILPSNINKQFELDHIIPVSQTTDNSLNNLVWCCISCNQQKLGKMPLQWLKNQQKEQFLSRVNKLAKNLSKAKINNLKSQELSEDFINRNLNDTRYITKFFLAYIKSELQKYEKETEVRAISSKVISKFRKKWLNGSAWGLDKKVRDITHFHHAVDAMILTQFKTQYEIEISTDLIFISNLWQECLQKRNSTKREALKLEMNNYVAQIKTKWLNRKRKDFVQLITFLIDNKDLNKPLYIKNLTSEIENRIPVILGIDECRECSEKKVLIEEKCTKCYGFVKFAYLKSLLNEEEWKEKYINNNIRGSGEYPLVSYMTYFKIRGSWGSQNFGFQLTGQRKEILKQLEKKKNKYYRIWKIDPNLKETKNQKKVDKKFWDKFKKEFENKESYLETKEGNVIELNKYYGLNLKKNKENKLEYEWLGVMSLLRKAKKTNDVNLKIQKRGLLVKGTNIKFYDPKEKKYLIQCFRSRKQPHLIYLNSNQLIEKDKTMNLNKIVKENKLEIVNIDILGKKTVSTLK